MGSRKENPWVINEVEPCQWGTGA